MGLFHKEEKSEAQKYMEARGKRMSATGQSYDRPYVRKDAQTHTYINGKKSHRSTQNKHVRTNDSATSNKQNITKNIVRGIEEEMRRVRLGLESSATQNAQQNVEDVWNTTFDDDRDFTPKSSTTRKSGGITVNGVHYDSLKEAWKKNPGFKAIVIIFGCIFVAPMLIEIVITIIGAIVMILGGLLG